MGSNRRGLSTGQPTQIEHTGKPRNNHMGVL